MRIVVQRDFGKCHICGHYGASSADHIIPDTEGGKTELGNLKAVHGRPRACLECSVAAHKAIFCNEIRGGYSIDRARRKIQEKTGLNLPVGEGSSPSVPDGPEGREWGLLVFLVWLLGRHEGT